MLILVPLLLLPSATLALVDCFSGFVGRMQASVEDSHFHINDTAMCSAMYCIKVILHSALDDDGIFQQGISSRCAYTGGDRQVCQKSEGKCQDISFYDGMKGNVSLEERKNATWHNQNFTYCSSHSVAAKKTSAIWQLKMN
uniref:UPAR/Ly6 domain-containing protein n=1 Tax=Caenorhabditis japonica TaxID=281687 RepID=A0A8R1HWU1_CAEJA